MRNLKRFVAVYEYSEYRCRARKFGLAPAVYTNSDCHMPLTKIRIAGCRVQKFGLPDAVYKYFFFYRYLQVAHYTFEKTDDEIRYLATVSD